MIQLRELSESDDLSSFSSGNEELDHWVRKRGLANQRHYGFTYVAIDAAVVAGFVTVCPSVIARNRIGGGGPDTWPVLLLGRMAVASDRQGTGVGSALMKHVFTLAVQQHLNVGCAAVTVDAKPGAVDYYVRYGFKRVRVPADAAPTSLITMYLSIKTVLAAMEPTT